MDKIEIILLVIITVIYCFPRKRKYKTTKLGIILKLMTVFYLVAGYLFIRSFAIMLFYNLCPTIWFEILLKYVVSPIITICFFAKALKIDFKKIKLNILNKINERKY